VLWRNLRLIVLLLVALGAVADLAPSADARMTAGLVLQLAGLFGFCFEVTVACNSFVRREQDERTMETLFTLPLPARVLLRDKILASLHLCWPYLLVAVVGMALHLDPARIAATWCFGSIWQALGALIALGHLIGFWSLTLVFSYTSRAPGWIGAGIVTMMSAIFYFSILGVLRATMGVDSWVLPIVQIWLAVVGGWILRELFKDFEKELLYPDP
jgi:hypothetical protein